MKKFLCICLLFFYSLISAQNNLTLSDTMNYGRCKEYDKYYDELKNYSVYGYKSEIFGYPEPSLEYYMVQGSLQETEIKTNIAIAGKGYFKLWDLKKKEYVYTRNGSFKYKDGYLVLKDRYVLNINKKLPAKNFALKEKTVYAEEKKQFEIELSLPVSKKEIIQKDIEIYHFSKVIITDDYNLLRGFLEMSTVKVYTHLWSMLGLLKKIEDGASLKKSGAGKKISLLEKCLIALIKQKNANRRQEVLYKYIPKIKIKYNQKGEIE